MRLKLKGGPSGLWGGGFQNCMAMSDPSQGHTAGLVVLGADTAGTHLSIDGGYRFEPNNAGKYQLYHQKTVGLEFDPRFADAVLCYTANGGDSGIYSAFWYGVVDVATKTLAWRKLKELTNSTFISRSDGATRPRQTGRMVAMDPATGGRGYFGFNDGVGLVTAPFSDSKGWTGTATVANLILNGSANADIVHGLIVDPNSTPTNTILYACVAPDSTAVGTTPTHAGVNKISRANFAPGSSTPPTYVNMSGSNSPVSPYGIAAVAVGGTTWLYVADGTNGVKRYNGSTWTDITPSGGGSQWWKGIDAVLLPNGHHRVIITNGTNNTLYKTAQIDTADTVGTSSSSWTTWGTTTGGSPNVAATVAYGNKVGAAWWLGSEQATYLMQTTSSNGAYTQVCIRRDNLNVALIPGRSGLWVKNQGSGDPVSGKWAPAMRGISAAVCHNVLCHPASQGPMVVGDTDWNVHHNAQGYHTQPIGDAGQVSGGDGRGLFIRQDGLVVVGMYSTTSGGVYTNPNLWTNDDPNPNWVSESWSAGPGDGGVLGVVAGVNGSGTRVLLAMCTGQTGTSGGNPVYGGGAAGGGIFIKTGSGSWTKVSGANAGYQATVADRLRFTWAGSGGMGNGANVSAFDSDAGKLWTSTNYGSAFADSGLTLPTGGNQYGGDLAASPTTPSTLFLTTSNNVLYKITNAFTSPVKTQLSGGVSTYPGDSPGAICTAPGLLIVSDNQTSSSAPALYLSRDNGATWHDVTSPEWRNGATFILSIDLDFDGHTVYGASYTSGIIMTKI